MKTAILICGAILMGLVSFNCSTPAYVERDNHFSRSDYKTYMWVETRARENDDSKRATAFADISVHNAVAAELENWGWRETTSNPDVLISYDVLVERGTESRSDPVYSQPFTRSYYNPYTRRWSTIYYPSQFIGYQEYETPVKDATVTITMFDANSDRKVWQGWTTERLTSSGFNDLDVNKSVRNIFKEEARNKE